MSRTFFVLLITAAALLPVVAGAAPSGAAPSGTLPRDVPAGHWAAGPVKRVVQQHILGVQADGRFQGDQPVTRYELAVALDRFVRYIETSRKPLHAESVQPTVKPLVGATPIQSQSLTHLVAYGFLPANSPLTQNGNLPVTANELSEALASVTIKLSDRAIAPHKE